MWKEGIILAMLSDPFAEQDKFGSTPVTYLATRIGSLSDESKKGDRESVVDAFRDIIIMPDKALMSLEPVVYWEQISFLLSFLPGSEKESLQQPILSKLFDEEGEKVHCCTPYVSTLLVHAFVGGVNGKLTTRQLEALSDVKESAPIAWVSAAVLSGLFDLARVFAVDLLRMEGVDLNRFFLGLRSWAALWPSEEEFYAMVKEFRDAIPTAEGKSTLDRWLGRLHQ